MNEQESQNDDLSAALRQRWQSNLTDLVDPSQEDVKTAFSGGCPQCREIGSSWVYLRMCLTCGEVSCCDSSPQTHARFHWEQAGHAVIRTIEPGEDWKFSYELNGFLT